MTFQYTPRQLRYIADVAEAVNNIPIGGVHTDEAKVFMAPVDVMLPEGKIAEIVYDFDDACWAINLTPLDWKPRLRKTMQAPDPFV